MDEATIARLVLGYLREEGCRGAYKDFIKASRHLETSKFSSSKYIPIRFAGLTLTDILKEYFEIYQTVQGRLEATNYYKELHQRSSLSHQLIYLLDYRGQLSRTSTPCFRSPAGSHFDETVYTDHVSDVETTPAHKLPGNIRCESEDSDVSNSPRKKNRFRKSYDSNVSTATDQDVPAEVVFDTEILAQTILENKEIPEKIAQTINKFAEKKHRVSTELDESIQTVIKETADDVFNEYEKILLEIIDSANGVDSSKTSNNQRVKSTSHTENTDSNHKVQNSSASSEVCETPHEAPPDKRVDEQNAEAILSIVERAKTSETETQTQATTQPQQVVDTGKSDVIVFDGTLDKYIISNLGIPAPVQQPQTPIVLNTAGGLLMVPSTIPTNISTPAAANQYYILNKQPLLNCYIPSQTVLTEKDILAMPTVIVNDDRPVSQPVKKTRSKPKIQPKPQIEVSTNINMSEFITLHKRDDIPKVEVKPPTETNSNIPPKDTKSEPSSTLPSLKCASEPEPDPVPTEVLADETKTTKSKTPNMATGTPPQTANPKKSTPKSGSHVRNLDFSTPPRITSTQKKSSRAQASDKKTAENKKQAAKTLFKTDEKTSGKPAIKSNDIPWDAKLRAFVPKTDNSKSKSPKPRRNSKQKKKNRTNESYDLNSTEVDGALLEAALKTPAKTDPNVNKDNATEKETEDGIPKETPSKFTNKEINVVLHADVIDRKRILKDVTVDGQNKTVLSPSKLNANKRNLVNDPENDKSGKFVTPDVEHDSLSYPIKANRNIISLLETPVKENVPKTPGVVTPNDFNLSTLSNFTPVAKMLEANLPGFDINLPTPNIPITPSFPPFTPTVDLMSPYSNRPTDYSTSSSYYQPSDNEQNKSLEAQLLELEKKPVCTDTKNDSGTSQTNEHLSIFNKNIIGKKNLNLMKRNEVECSSSSNDSSSSSNSSEDENESSINWTEKESNDTVICKKKTPETPRKTYLLRNRNGSGKTVAKSSNEKETSLAVENQCAKVTKHPVKSGSKTPKKHGNRSVGTEEEQLKGGKKSKEISDDSAAGKSIASSKSTKGRVSSGQESVRKELEEKKLRVLNTFKSNENVAKTRKNNARFMKIKPIPNLSNQRRKPRKSNSPKKNTTNKNESLISILRKDLADSECETEDDISLRLSVSEDDDNVQAQTNEIVVNLENTPSDVEAQTLIEGLRERGIHLMHNKTTKASSSCQALETEGGEENGEGGDENKSNISYVKEVVPNSSEVAEEEGPTMNYSLRDEYDTRTLTEEVHFTHDGSDTVLHTVESFDISSALKKLKAKLYIEDIDKEVDIQCQLTEFGVLLDINPVDQEQIEELKKISREKYERKSEKENKICQSETVVKQNKEHITDITSQSPSSRKRKYQGDEESEEHNDKKCKSILEQLNVDTFLNNIHGSK